MMQPKNIALTALALVFLVSPAYAEAANKKAEPVKEVTASAAEAEATPVVEEAAAVPAVAEKKAPAAPEAVAGGHHMPQTRLVVRWTLRHV